MPTTGFTRVVALAAAAALTTLTFTATTSPSATARVATAEAGISGGKQAAAGDRKAAKAALTKVQQIFAPKTKSQARALIRQRADATLALKDLANLQSSLSPADREAARALFRRPTDPGGDGDVAYGTAESAPVCSTDICVHYVTTTGDAATPEYVAQTLTTMTEVHDTYLAAGYREPTADGTAGGDDRIDIYLANIGPDGYYGYCNTDQPDQDPLWSRWAYCVLDNDYATVEFPTNTPLENLQVTAAHEYFHATQFAYDAYEDNWLLEATAAWIEDEMFDDVDDNLQYLPSSQMKKPSVPLDTFGNTFHYGTWSFFRFLTETFPAEKGELPELVLDIFEKAASVGENRGQYSWQAVDNALKARVTTGAAMLAAYAVANRRPGVFYSEGAANNYPSSPLKGGSATLSPGSRSASGNPTMKHLTTWTAALKPHNLNGAWKLRVVLDMAPTSIGSAAIVTTVLTSGVIKTARVALNSNGNGTKVVPFSSSTVRTVEVTMVNGSGRFRCFTGGGFSCQGNPRDNNVKQLVRVTAFQ